MFPREPRRGGRDSRRATRRSVVGERRRRSPGLLCRSLPHRLEPAFARGGREAVDRCEPTWPASRGRLLPQARNRSGSRTGRDRPADGSAAAGGRGIHGEPRNRRGRDRHEACEGPRMRCWPAGRRHFLATIRSSPVLAEIERLPAVSTITSAPHGHEFAIEAARCSSSVTADHTDQLRAEIGEWTTQTFATAASHARSAPR